MPGSVRLASRISRAGWIHQNQYAGVRTLGLKRRGWYAGVRWYLSCQGVSFMPVSVCQFHASVGHFSQVVWERSRELGVGKDKSKSGKIIVVANYDPPGNMLGDFSKNVHPLR
uniref:Cysteine-rich venom protein n=1 Tax=Strigamia maritima TaxID=126957 RepID=T1JL05_STRMM